MDGGCGVGVPRVTAPPQPPGNFRGSLDDNVCVIIESRTPTRILVLPVAALVGLAALTACSKKSNDSPTIAAPSASASTSASAAVSASPTPSPAGNVTVFTIKVAAGKAVGGVQSLSAKLGATVEVVVTSDDTTSVIHIHGYDLMDAVQPGKPGKITFVAKISGVFEIELEDTSVKIANLTVR